MATTPPQDTAPAAAAEETITPGPNIGSAQQAEGMDLPEGFTSWEDYNQKGGVLEEAAASGDTTAATEGDDTLAGAEAKDDVTETPEAKAQRVEETVKLSVDGMEPEMAEAVTPFVKAWAENGTLTDEEVTKAAAATKMSEAMVRQYMAGATALQAQASNADAVAQAAFVAPFYQEFGGETGYAEFQAWTAEKDNLTQDEQDAFNDALDNSPKAALQMAKQFKARMEAQGAGSDPTDLTRGTGAESNSEKGGYGSQAEMEEDMSNPKYREDAAFRASVAGKLAKSNF